MCSSDLAVAESRAIKIYVCNVMTQAGETAEFAASDHARAVIEQAGVPVFDYNYFEKHTVVKGKEPIPAGEATVEVDFDYQGVKDKPGGPAAITLKVNGKLVGEAKMTATVAGRFGIDTFGIGEDSGQPVTPDYQPPFRFTGTIDKVVISLGPPDLKE